jgi:uncharacterized protein
MDMTGTQRIGANPDVVWEALNSVEVLRQCIPGCEDIQAVSPTEFKAKITLQVAMLRATFAGQIILSDIDRPHGYTITGTGSGGVAGFAKGSAKVRLQPENGATVLTYEVKAALGGKIAVGAKVMDSTAKKLASEFFGNLNQVLSNHAPAAA